MASGSRMKAPPQALKRTDKDYGTPVAGSKTEARGKQAHQRVSREILELCCVIEENGVANDSQSGQSWTAQIDFGRLFDIYVHISNKLVGILLRARKYGLVDFEGECLFQGRDNKVPVRLLHPAQKVKQMLKEKSEFTWGKCM